MFPSRLGRALKPPTLERLWTAGATTYPPQSPDVWGVRCIYGYYQDVDQDGDGYTDVKEAGSDHRYGGQRDPNSFWDFFDVPAPAPGTGTDGKLTILASNVRNKAVNLSDVSTILAYVGRTSTNNGAYYYNSDTNNDGFPDGSQMDRTPSTIAGETWHSGPPNGGISLGDVGVALEQVGDNCN